MIRSIWFKIQMIPQEQSKLICLPLSPSAQSPPKTQVTHLYWFLVCPYRIWTNISSHIPSTHIHFLHKRRHATVMTAPRFSSVYPETCPRRTHTNSLFFSTSATLYKEGPSFTELVFHSQTFEVLHIFYYCTNAPGNNHVHCSCHINICR